MLKSYDQYQTTSTPSTLLSVDSIELTADIVILSHTNLTDDSCKARTISSMCIHDIRKDTNFSSFSNLDKNHFSCFQIFRLLQQ